MLLCCPACSGLGRGDDACYTLTSYISGISYFAISISSTDAATNPFGSILELSAPSHPSSMKRWRTASTTSTTNPHSLPCYGYLLCAVLLLAATATQSYGASEEGSMGAASVDPCRRQPFRGRCPASNGGGQTRSQFVLRYYLRNGECVSYPYGGWPFSFVRLLFTGPILLFKSCSAFYFLIP